MASRVRADPNAAPSPDCEPHTPMPAGYLAWHEWAGHKLKTHEPRRCKGCGLWVIWEPKEDTDGN